MITYQGAAAVVTLTSWEVIPRSRTAIAHRLSVSWRRWNTLICIDFNSFRSSNPFLFCNHVWLSQALKMKKNESTPGFVSGVELTGPEWSIHVYNINIQQIYIMYVCVWLMVSQQSHVHIPTGWVSAGGEGTTEERKAQWLCPPPSSGPVWGFHSGLHQKSPAYHTSLSCRS